MSGARDWLLDMLRRKAMRGSAFDYATLWSGGRFVELSDFLQLTGFNKSLKHCYEKHSNVSGITRRRYVEWVCGHTAVFLDNFNLARYADQRGFGSTLMDHMGNSYFTFMIVLEHVYRPADVKVTDSMSSNYKSALSVKICNLRCTPTGSIEGLSAFAEADLTKKLFPKWHDDISYVLQAKFYSQIMHIPGIPGREAALNKISKEMKDTSKLIPADNLKSWQSVWLGSECRKAAVELSLGVPNAYLFLGNVSESEAQLCFDCKRLIIGTLFLCEEHDQPRQFCDICYLFDDPSHEHTATRPPPNGERPHILPRPRAFLEPNPVYVDQVYVYSEREISIIMFSKVDGDLRFYRVTLKDDVKRVWLQREQIELDVPMNWHRNFTMAGKRRRAPLRDPVDGCCLVGSSAVCPYLELFVDPPPGGFQPRDLDEKDDQTTLLYREEDDDDQDDVEVGGAGSLDNMVGPNSLEQLKKLEGERRGTAQLAESLCEDTDSLSLASVASDRTTRTTRSQSRALSRQ